MKLSGSEILIRALDEEGVDTIFGYPGGSVIDIYDKLYKSQIRHILVRHEQGAAHAADGYARASGKVGVCLVTSGPGATNTVTGIATAYMDSIPMVVITGQVSTPYIGTDAFQEADITGITRPCTKHNFLVRRVEDLAKTVKEAFFIARSGRPGPVLIDIPKDVMQSVTEYKVPSRIELDLPDPIYVPDVKRLYRLLELMQEAEKPLIMVGGGILLGKASEELKEFEKRVKIPVVSTLMGIGSYPGSDPLWLGMVGMHGTYYANMSVSHCDLLIVIGARFSDRVTGKIADFAPHAKIVHIDIDAASINKNVMVDVPIVSDCKSALVQLNQLCEQKGYEIPETRVIWLDKIENWRKTVPLTYCANGTIKPQQVIQKIYELTKGKAIIATEVGQNQMWTAQYYHFDYPNHFLSSGGLGTMGYGFPAAIGAQVAFPDHLVVDIAGDGSIQMNIQELATAVVNELPVKIAILNNGFLGMVRQWQEVFYERRYSHTNIGREVPDFVKLAQAYGAVGLRATKPGEVESVLKEGLTISGTVVMDFHVDPEECVLPMVGPGDPLTMMRLEQSE